MSNRKSYLSSQKVVDSSSEDEEQPISRPIEQSPSRSRSPSRSISSSPSSSSPSSRSPSKSPSPDPSSYTYVPPSGYQISTSKENSVLPKLRSNKELFLFRVPRSVQVQNIQINLRKRKIRIGEEKWKLLDQEVGNVKILRPLDGTDKYGLGNSCRSVAHD